MRAAVEQRFGAGSIEVAIQAEQRGTGHAVLQVEPLLAAHDGLVLILYGDMPLLTQPVLERLVQGASATTLTHADGAPARSARLRPHRARRRRQVRAHRRGEGRHAERAAHRRDQRRHLLRAGALLPRRRCARSAATTRRARSTSPTSSSAPRASCSVVTVEAAADEVMGCNDRVDVARADRVMRLRLADELMRAGVAVRDPERLYVEPGVEVGRDTRARPRRRAARHASRSAAAAPSSRARSSPTAPSATACTSSPTA